MNDFILGDYLTVSFTDVPDWMLQLIRDIQIYYNITSRDNHDLSYRNLNTYHWLSGLGKPYFIDYLTKLGIEYEYFNIEEDNGYRRTMASGIVFKCSEELTTLILSKTK